MKHIKAHQTDKVSFGLRADGYWIIKSVNHIGYVLSNSNCWTKDYSDEKQFSFLHVAVNFAKRRVFNFEVPEYTYEIINDDMHIYIDGQEKFHVRQIKSDKQASDKMKELFAINVSKMDGL